MHLAFVLCFTYINKVFLLSFFTFCTQGWISTSVNPLLNEPYIHYINIPHWYWRERVYFPTLCDSDIWRLHIVIFGKSVFAVELETKSILCDISVWEHVRITQLTSFQRNLLLFFLGNLEKTFRNQFVTLNKNKKWFYWIASFNMFIISDRQASETLHLSWVVCGEFKWTYYASYSVAFELLLNG